jgi:hypothetical protein
MKGMILVVLAQTLMKRGLNGGKTEPCNGLEWLHSPAKLMESVSAKVIGCSVLMRL